MIFHHLPLFLYVLGAAFYFNTAYADKYEPRPFPDGFLIGAATSSYQIEGAWNISDKGENVWDQFTHTRFNGTRDGSTGDIACDSYHKYKEDVQLLKQLGMDFYRFSLSWSRILPKGYSNYVSKDGVRYYNNLLDELEKNGIQPFVTLYHWDHPQLFEDMGGWMNEDIVDLFGDYARVVFREFGHRVKFFATMNEPYVLCNEAYYLGIKAPALKLGRHAEYLCTHNIIKAHARAYHIYNDEFRKKQNGKIGIVLSGSFFYPKYKNDTTSSEIAFQFTFGRFIHPIYSKEGDYPAIMKERIAENSKFEGLERSRLPTFSTKWINYIKGTFDYLGLNHYTSNIVEPTPKTNKTIYLNDDGLIYSKDPKWPSSATDWLKVVPQGFFDILHKIKEDYGNPPVYITENGYSDNGKTLLDDRRIHYLHSYMNAMLNAIKIHGCNVKGYAVWSLIDNFEWTRGYTEKFGLYHVDFNHPNRTRTPKKSVSWLTNVIRTRRLQPFPKKNFHSPSFKANLII